MSSISLNDTHIELSALSQNKGRLKVLLCSESPASIFFNRTNGLTLPKKKEKKEKSDPVSQQCGHFDKEIFPPLLCFLSKMLCILEEVWQTATVLVIAISNEGHALIRDKTLRNSTGRDKRAVCKGSFS